MKTSLYCLILCGSFALGASGATYRGRNIDSVKYDAVAEGKETVELVSVMFDGKAAFIRFGDRFVTAKLAIEEIDNPENVEVSDGFETWVLNVDVEKPK